MKLLEHTYKNAKAYFKSGNDTSNFSVQPPETYARRFIDLCQIVLKNQNRYRMT